MRGLGTSTRTLVIIPSRLTFPLGGKDLWFLQCPPSPQGLLQGPGALPWHIDPETRPRPYALSLPWNVACVVVPVVEDGGGSGVCQGTGRPQALPAVAPGKHWAELMMLPPTTLLQLPVAEGSYRPF